jgi:peptidoglycan DL-endopeptidase CwlO
VTLRPNGRHRAPSRLNTAALTRSAAVAATSTGLLAGTAVAASANPNNSQEPATGLAAADTLVRVAEAVAAAEKPVVATPAPEVIEDAVSFGTSGFTAVEIVAEAPAPTQAEVAVEERTSASASRTEERAAAPEQEVAEQAAPEQAAPEQAAEPAEPAQEAAPAQQAAPAQESAPAPTGGILSIAEAYTGIYYVYGGSTPSGFDCSGYTQYVFGQAGISLPRTAAAQQAAATPVSNPQPGDLVFFGYPAYHVGIYAGGGMMYDSGKPGIPSQKRAIFSGVSGYGRVG